jgi:hypothetical protein
VRDEIVGEEEDEVGLIRGKRRPQNTATTATKIERSFMAALHQNPVAPQTPMLRRTCHDTAAAA